MAALPETPQSCVRSFPCTSTTVGAAHRMPGPASSPEALIRPGGHSSPRLGEISSKSYPSSDIVVRYFFRRRSSAPGRYEASSRSEDIAFCPRGSGWTSPVARDGEGVLVARTQRRSYPLTRSGSRDFGEVGGKLSSRNRNNVSLTAPCDAAISSKRIISRLSMWLASSYSTSCASTHCSTRDSKARMPSGLHLQCASAWVIGWRVTMTNLLPGKILCRYLVFVMLSGDFSTRRGAPMFDTYGRQLFHKRARASGTRSASSSSR